MPKCPYCKDELELKLKIKPVTIDEEFRNSLIDTNTDIMDLQFEIQKELIDYQPGLGIFKGLSKRMYNSKFVQKYIDLAIKRIEVLFDRWAAVPFMYQICKKCDTVINTEMMMDLIALDNIGMAGVGTSR